MLCSGCKKDKPETEFRFRGEPPRPYGQCKACRRTAASGNPRLYLSTLIVGSRKRKGDAGIKRLTVDYLYSLLAKQGGCCPLTGLPLTFIHGRGRVFTNASLDRIDQSRGYVQGNVRLVTMWANLARNTLTDADFVHYCSLVVSRAVGPPLGGASALSKTLPTTPLVPPSVSSLREPPQVVTGAPLDNPHED